MSLGLIQGKATHVVWPPKRWQRLENFVPEDRLVAGEDSLPGVTTVKGVTAAPEADTGGASLSCHNQSISFSKADESSSVSELIYGPIR